LTVFEAGPRAPPSQRNARHWPLSVFAPVQLARRALGSKRVCRTKRLRVLAKEARERAEEALSLAETFRDPEARRIMREVAEG